ncbi:hypothetical protein MPLB_1760109 [Mesorhizobium sp. ORS 3324]|nr:hypothetical protein MPLB_1760109 [Mesorhizobium sp. ORS 3324]
MGATLGKQSIKPPAPVNLGMLVLL